MAELFCDVAVIGAGPAGLAAAGSAKKAGADCIKFQTFKAKNLVSKNAEKAEYQKKTTPSKSQYYK